MPFTVKGRRPLPNNSLGNGIYAQIYAMSVEISDESDSTQPPEANGACEEQHATQDEYCVQALAVRQIKEMDSVELAHHRLGHISMQAIAELGRLTQGMPRVRISKAQANKPLWEICQSCGVSRMKQLESKQLVQERPDQDQSN